MFWTFIGLEKAHEKIDEERLQIIVRLCGPGGWRLKEWKVFIGIDRACVRVGNSSVNNWFSVKVRLHICKETSVSICNLKNHISYLDFQNSHHF